MNFKSVKEILTAIKNKDVSVIELTSNYLDKIKERDDELNCFVTLTAVSYTHLTLPTMDSV